MAESLVPSFLQGQRCREVGACGVDVVSSFIVRLHGPFTGRFGGVDMPVMPRFRVLWTAPLRERCGKLPGPANAPLRTFLTQASSAQRPVREALQSVARPCARACHRQEYPRSIFLQHFGVLCRPRPVRSSGQGGKHAFLAGGRRQSSVQWSARGRVLCC